MEIINKRYRIIKLLKRERLSNSYLVNDMVKGVKTLQLNLLNNEYISKDLIEYYTENFTSLTNINTCNIICTKSFDIIKTIDNNKLNENLYFYTNEYMISNYNLAVNIPNLSQKERLDIFLEVCNAMYYLHQKGFIYGDLNLTNILVNKSEEKLSVKLKDLATIALDKYDYWTDSDNSLAFKAPEIKEGELPSQLSDIYSLGKLLELLNIDNSKLENLIAEITAIAPEKRISNILSIIKEINNLFGIDYNPLSKQYFEVLNFNTKLSGRSYEISQVFNIYDDINQYTSEKKCILIHGNFGVGKTRLVKEIVHRLNISGAKIYSSFVLNNYNEMNNKPIIDILKKEISECNPDVLVPYENELIKLIPEIGVNKKIIPTEPLDSTKETFRILNAATNFLYDCTKEGTTTVLTIDNLNTADDLSLEFFEHIYHRKTKSKKILFIVSYSDENLVSNKKLASIIDGIYLNPDVLNLYLHGLNELETGEMIKNILSMPKVPKHFARLIFNKTYGNPLFIEECIKNLIAKKALYIDENGYWGTDYYTDEYEKLPIPTSMEQAVANQIKDLNKTDLDILEIVSIFYKGVSVTNITKLLRSTNSSPIDVIQNLVSKGILCEKIEDSGVIYDFSNKLLKEHIYSKLNANYRITMHKKAAKVLECSLGNSFENHEELIYHLENAQENQKAILYYLQNAEKMLSLGNRQGAINYYCKSLNIVKSSKDFSKQLELQLAIANVYLDESDSDSALKYYMDSADLAENLHLNFEKILIYNKLANIYLSNKNDIEKSEYYLEKSKTVLSTVDYKEGYLEYNKIKSKILYIQGKYNEAHEICMYSIDLCMDDFPSLKAYFYNNIANIYLCTYRVNKALDTYSIALELYKKADNKKGIALVLNNLGATSADYLQDTNKSIDYFMQTLKICQENNMVSESMYTLANLGESYLAMFDYDKALKCFESSYEKSSMSDYEGTNLYNAAYLLLTYIKLNDFKNALEFYDISKDKISSVPDTSEEYSCFMLIYAQFFYQLGNLDKSREYLDIAMGSSFSSTKQTCDELILKEKLDISMNFKNKNQTTTLSSDYYWDIINKYSQIHDKVTSTAEICVLLLRANNAQLAKELFKNIQDIDILSLPERLQSKIMYLKSVLFSPVDEKDILIKAADVANKNKQHLLNVKIKSRLGKLYYLSGNYYYSINYYFEACEIIRKLTLQLSKDYRLQFINNSEHLKPFIMLELIKNNILKINNIYTENEHTIQITNENELKDLLSYSSLRGILTDKYFLSTVKKIFSQNSTSEVSTVRSLLENITSDAYNNLDLISKYLSNTTLASDCRIIIEDSAKNLYPVVSTNGSSNISDITQIIENVKRTKSPYLSANNFENLAKQRDFNSFQFSSSIMCLPVLMEEDNTLKVSCNKRNLPPSSTLIKGYVYMASNKILNNFNKDSLNECKKILNLLGFTIENYQLKISASIDKLTGTITRKYLDMAISSQIDLSFERNDYFSIIMFDLDHFKIVNDKYGHQTGDKVLEKVCSIVLENLRKDDICGRYGGEEFIIILPHTKQDDALLVADKLRNKVQKAEILGPKQPITVSMGISSYPNHSQWKDDLIGKADQALYISKELGRNHCEIWNESLSETKHRTSKLLGIISGNTVEDSRNVEVMIELLSLIKSKMTKSDKIYNILGRIIEVSEAQAGVILVYEKGKQVKRYCRKAFKEDWHEINSLNGKIISSVLENKKGVFMIDWDEISEYNPLTGVPQWNSVVAIPLIYSGLVKGLLYLTVPINIKEFNFNDFNFISFLADICTTII